jgi:hypothetical protein
VLLLIIHGLLESRALQRACAGDKCEQAGVPVCSQGGLGGGKWDGCGQPDWSTSKSYFAMFTLLPMMLF